MTFMAAMPPATPSLTPIWIVAGYLLVLVALGVVTGRLFRGTSADWFLASRSLGSFLLLMGVFGTTMTAFAMVGSTGAAYDRGIGVYGLMASSSGLIHSVAFFLIGIRLWAIGKRYDLTTQIAFFRERFESPLLGWLLFPVLVGLVVPYILLGVLGAGATVRGVTANMFPDLFPGTKGAVPEWLTGLVVCAVVLFYVFTGGMRGAAWANAFQTIVFMAAGIVAFVLVAKALGGMREAAALVEANAPELLAREGEIGRLEFTSYLLVPLSVAMFPHLFQFWLTAKRASTFRLTVVAHPFFIMLVWMPCILIGIWAAGKGIDAPGGNSNAVLGKAVRELLHNPLLTGLLTAGILAAILGGLDAQFICVGSMFTNDVVIPIFGRERFSDRAVLRLGRAFIVLVAAVTYLLSFFPPPHIFDLGVWCFSGFASLFPLVFAALYWRRATKAGAIASVVVMAVTWFALFYRDVLAPVDAEGGAAKAGGGGESLLFGMMPVVVIFTASTLALVVISLVTRPPARATIERFVPRLLSAEEPGGGAGGPAR